jgi:mannose-6-phosphate isomerase-like protein (cupin superfamily)
LIKHITYTNVHLYILEGKGVLEAGTEVIPLSADELIEIPPETPHRIINDGDNPLRLLNIKAPRALKSTHLVTEG